MSTWLLAAVLAVYGLPGLFPDPALAFYIGRGLLGCVFAFALWRGIKISGWVALVVCMFEASSSLCGALFAYGSPKGTNDLCDVGTGLPLNLLGLTAVLAALLPVANENFKLGKK